MINLKDSFINYAYCIDVLFLNISEIEYFGIQ